MTPANPDYPVRVEVEHPQRLSHLLPLVKWLLAVPHYIALWVLGIGASFALLFAWFAVLITGRFPAGLFDFLVGFERWRVRVEAYLLLQTDQYPPFSLADDPSYPVRLEIDYPERIARWRPLVNWLLVIPALVVAFLVAIVACVAVIGAFFSILVTGTYPDSMFNAVTIAERWYARVLVFAYWMTERYPPFVWA